MGKPNCEEKRNIANAYLNASTEITTGSDQIKKVPLNECSIIGDKLTFDSSKQAIVIGAGVKKIKVDAILNSKSTVANSINGLYINKNNTNVGISYNTCFSTEDYNQTVLLGRMIDVVEGDEITLVLRTVAYTNKTVKINGSAHGTQTNLLVEVLE